MQEFLSHIDKETVRSLSKVLFAGEIVVVNNHQEADAAVEYLSNFDVIGFDTETRPSFHKGKKHTMALLQLSSCERAYLFRLHSIGITDSLACLFENGRVKKIGVAIHDDLKGLGKIRKFNPEGFIDLQKFVQQFGIMEKSLQKIAAIVLNVRVSKSQRLTNWENVELTNSQRLYAATDAWVCCKIYETLMGLK